MSKPSKDYDVGYGKTPVHSRFKTGQSGNPAGRPKGSKNLQTLLAEELERPVEVTVNGQRRKMSKARVMVVKHVDRAINGSARAFSMRIGANDRDEFDKLVLEYRHDVSRADLVNIRFQSRLGLIWITEVCTRAPPGRRRLSQVRLSEPKSVNLSARPRFRHTIKHLPCRLGDRQDGVLWSREETYSSRMAPEKASPSGRRR